MTVKINTTLPNDNNAPLYAKYPTELQSQPAYLRMDEVGDVDVYVSGEIGNATPMDVWHDRTLRWTLSSRLARGQVETLLADPDVIDLLGRIHASHSVEWDGSNFAGDYDEDLYEELQRLLDDRYNYDPEAQAWDADDWLFASNSLAEVWPADEPLDIAAKRLEDEAELDGVVLNGTVRDALIRYLEGEDPDELSGEHLRAYNEHVAD